MPQKYWFLTLGLSWALLFQYCAHPPEIDSNSVFRYNEYRNVTSLDPAFARNPQNIWPINQLFNGLVQLDSTLSIQPEIAKHWSLNKEGTTYTFVLRDDVYFHPSPHFGRQKTRKVVAQDFVYSFDRLLDPQLASPGRWVMQQVAHYEALNDSVFQIELKNPFPAFLGLLSMRYCAVVPQEAASLEDFRKNPIGTGPFYFKRWEENVKLVLRRNPNYFEQDSKGQKLPYLEAIAIQFIPDIQSEFMLFLQGKLDFINSIDATYKDQLLNPQGNLRPKYESQFVMQKGPYLNTEYIGFNLEAKNTPIEDIRIREALNIGFNRASMIAYLRNNIGTPAKKGFIPKGLAGSSQTDFIYDPVKARALVAAHKEEYGDPSPIRIATDANYVDLCEFLQSELEKIGLSIQIDIMPTATLRQAKSKGQLELFRASWIADYPDAENYLSLFYSKNFSPNGPNYTHYANAQFDALYEQAVQTLAEPMRVERYQKMDSLALSSFPLMPLYYDEVVRFTQKKITGIPLNPINVLDLKRAQKKTTPN